MKPNLIMLPSNKKISVLHPNLLLKGGAVKMMLSLACELDNNDLKFYCFSHNAKIYNPSDYNFSIISYSGPKIFKIFKIAYEIRKSDFIIVGNSPMHFVSVISKILFFSRAKIIWWNHHYPWYHNKNTPYIRLKRVFEKIALSKIDLVVSNSKYLKKHIDNIWNIDSHILYPFLGEDYVKIESKTNNRENIMFSFSRWTEGKNLSKVFELYDSLKKEIKDLKLVVGGEGVILDSYKSKYSNNSNVKILGRLDSIEIIDILDRSKLFFFPSMIDSFGIVILESLSRGVPVIGYNVNSSEELIENGFNGFLVNSDKDLIEKSKILLNDEFLDYSKNAKDSSNRYTKEIFNKQLSEIFSKF